MASISKDVDAVVASVAGGINDMIMRVTMGTDRKAKIKTVADEIMILLESHGLAYKEVVKPRACCVHPENRFGAGIEAHDVHHLLSAIMREGWSWMECVGARAIELSPGSTGKMQLDFNETLHSASEGMLAPVMRHDVKILTLTCSHTVAGLRCVLSGCKGILMYM